MKLCCRMLCGLYWLIWFVMLFNWWSVMILVCCLCVIIIGWLGWWWIVILWCVWFWLVSCWRCVFMRLCLVWLNGVLMMICWMRFSIIWLMCNCVGCLLLIMISDWLVCCCLLILWCVWLVLSVMMWWICLKVCCNWSRCDGVVFCFVLFICVICRVWFWVWLCFI